MSELLKNSRVHNKTMYFILTAQCHKNLTAHVTQCGSRSCQKVPAHVQCSSLVCVIIFYNFSLCFYNWIIFMHSLSNCYFYYTTMSSTKLYWQQSLAQLVGGIVENLISSVFDMSQEFTRRCVFLVASCLPVLLILC